MTRRDKIIKSSHQEKREKREQIKESEIHDHSRRQSRKRMDIKINKRRDAAHQMKSLSMDD